MLIGGYQKLTLIDYPGKLATTVFTVGCSFRCPFCHNPELVDLALCSGQPAMSEENFINFLKKRQGKLEGVCITGGEPTIQPDIIEFIKKIKKLGFLVKLDSNGSRPDVLKEIFDQRLVSYVAMDIKSSQEKYSETAGTDVDIDRVKLSVDLIRNSGVEYEFRTTVVPGLHTERDFDAIARWLDGAKRYYLQKYRELRILDPQLAQKTKGKQVNLQQIKKNIEAHFGEVGIRE